jgi:hypothetical protein
MFTVDSLVAIIERRIGAPAIFTRSKASSFLDDDVV